MPVATGASDRAAVARVAAPAGEGPQESGPEAAPDQGGATGADAHGRVVRRPVRERAGLRQSRKWENPSSLGDRSRTDPNGPEGLLPQQRLDGSGSAGGQAGSEVEPRVQEPVAV